MAPDFRNDKMDSLEGKGIARGRREDAGRRFGDLPPAKGPLGRAIRREKAWQVSDLMGFWLMWHLHGGFEGLEDLGMERSTIFRRIKRFRTLFGKHPDEYLLPGVSLDLRAYNSAVVNRKK